ncbi:hypothetical protein N7508_005047 [Penicillium antarcticum]|nr:uncharacterized protein N7508_005047 [Penicillium antarcticum]KAJ5306032.1 hypothetical protein N7508_005047 [Penicillium antarcticum]
MPDAGSIQSRHTLMSHQTEIAPLDEADKTHSMFECSELLHGLLPDIQQTNLPSYNTTEPAEDKIRLDVVAFTPEDTATEVQPKKPPRREQ